jgi:Tfp pilus assembly protein PilX
MKSRRGITLILILAVILVVVWLAHIALVLISSQSRLTHHQVSRIQAFYAAQAGINYALERLRVGDWSPAPASDDTYYCINGPVDGGVACSDAIGNRVEDVDIAYNVQIRLYHLGGGINGTTQIEAKAEYTYQE